MINALLLAMAALAADDELLEDDSGAELVSVGGSTVTREIR